MPCGPAQSTSRAYKVVALVTALKVRWAILTSPYRNSFNKGVLLPVLTLRRRGIGVQPRFFRRWPETYDSLRVAKTCARIGTRGEAVRSR